MTWLSSDPTSDRADPVGLFSCSEAAQSLGCRSGVVSDTFGVERLIVALQTC